VKIPEPKLYPWKTHVECKVFWVGSPPSKSYPRGTSESAWNKKWVADFGGTDFPSPDSRIANHQTGEFRPKAFTPKENPFYISLPYDDLAQLEGYRPEAHKVIPWFNPNISGPRKSFCKGAWLQIFHNGRSCYAQWEAVGPNFSDDWEYVFGKKPPKSHAAGGSGLGISPAIRDYLQITDDKKVHWRFVESRNVPLGPWKTFGRANTGDLPTTETEGIEAQRKYLEYLRKLRDEQFRK